MYMWDMTHSYLQHASFISGTWRINLLHDVLSCRTRLFHIWDMTHSYVGRDSWLTGQLWTMIPMFCGSLIHMWDMTHAYVRHDSFICGTWPVHMWDMTYSYVGRDSWLTGRLWTMILFCGSLIHMWDMTHSCVRHDSFICGPWLIHMWAMTHSYAGHDSCIYGPWLMHMWDMGSQFNYRPRTLRHFETQHLSPFMCGTWLIHSVWMSIENEWVLSQTWMGSHVLKMNESCPTRDLDVSHTRIGSHVRT